LYIDSTGDELDKASIGLGLSPLGNFDKNPSLSGSDLKKWVMDVFYHPSNTGVIATHKRIVFRH
jgi:hypothetical protein